MLRLAPIEPEILDICALGGKVEGSARGGESTTEEQSQNAKVHRFISVLSLPWRNPWFGGVRLRYSKGMVHGALTRSEVETIAAEVVGTFHREQHGRTPGSCRAFLVEDMVLVRLEDAFTPIELDLIQTEQGKKLVQSSRRDLRALTRRQVESRLASALGVEIDRSFCDFDVRNGMEVDVYVLSRPLETA